MIEIYIPGKNITYRIKKLLLDLNGTIAVDGKLIEGVAERINILKNNLDIYILTADTFGSARNIADTLKIDLYEVDKENGALDKKEFVKKLGAQQCVAIGNGYNDRLMFKEAALSIFVVEREGACVQTLQNADLIVTSINDALDMFINPLRVTANLRA